MKNKKNKTELECAMKRTGEAVTETNRCIEKLGEKTHHLYKALNDMQDIFDNIRNIPGDERLQCEALKKIRLTWMKQALKIEEEYKNAVAKNVGAGAAAVGVGVAVMAMGPAVAMGVATTFGVASTGTAIAALNGAAATNAALAWLGGGALAVGGGGMAAGNAFLALAGPVGFAIAGVALVSSGLLLWKNKHTRKRLEEIYINICKRDENKYKLAIVELNERIVRINGECEKLNKAINRIKSYGSDYNEMTEAQQYELGAYVNLMLSSTQLLTNPVLGLQPKYTEDDYNHFIASIKDKSKNVISELYQNQVIMLANFLYKIELDKKDKKILWKSLRKNKEYLESLKINRRLFKQHVIDIAQDALDFKYQLKSDIND